MRKILINWAFLSDNTYIWCEEALKSLHHPENPVASEFLSYVCHFLVPAWCHQLRIKIRDYIESGAAPILSLAPKLDTARQWQVRQQVIGEMRNEADTFGLVETGMDKQEDLHEEESLQDGENSDTADGDWDY